MLATPSSYSRYNNNLIMTAAPNSLVQCSYSNDVGNHFLIPSYDLALSPSHFTRYDKPFLNHGKGTINTGNNTNSSVNSNCNGNYLNSINTNIYHQHDRDEISPHSFDSNYDQVALTDIYAANKHRNVNYWVHSQQSSLGK